VEARAVPENILTATTGRPSGSAAARRLRAEGHIPGVLYGHGMTPVPLSVERRELRQALAGPAGFNTLINLAVDGKTYPAIIKDFQRHPIRRNVAHIDFQQVSLTESITISVPVRLEGEAKAVVAAGGLVDPMMDTIEVNTTPNNMPNEIVIDISAMKPGDIIRLADIALPKGVTAVADPDTTIVTAIHGSTEADGQTEAEAEAAEAATGDGDSASA
jgi:large subunit ribosomal protein L25